MFIHTHKDFHIEGPFGEHMENQIHDSQNQTARCLPMPQIQRGEGFESVRSFKYLGITGANAWHHFKAKCASYNIFKSKCNLNNHQRWQTKIGHFNPLVETFFMLVSFCHSTWKHPWHRYSGWNPLYSSGMWLIFHLDGAQMASWLTFQHRKINSFPVLGCTNSITISQEVHYGGHWWHMASAYSIRVCVGRSTCILSLPHIYLFNLQIVFCCFIISMVPISLYIGSNLV